MESRSKSTTQSINCELACKMVAIVPKKKKGFRICHVPPATSWKVVKCTTQEQQNKVFVTGSAALHLTNCRVLHHKSWRSKPTKQQTVWLRTPSMGPVMGPHTIHPIQGRGCVCSWHHENELFCGIQAPSLFGSQLCPLHLQPPINSKDVFRKLWD